MEPLWPKINYSYRQCVPTQGKGSQGRVLPAAEHRSACGCLCGGDQEAGFPRAHAQKQPGQEV